MTVRDRERDWYVGGLVQFWALMAVGMVAAVAFMLFVIPSSVWAYATIEGPPTFSSAPGLPDGRVYEQVSPANKNGNQAGATTDPYETDGAENKYGYTSPNGDAMLFEGTGAMGESASGANMMFVATKNAGAAGWNTRSLTPAPHALAEDGEILAAEQLQGAFTYIDPSRDLSHAMFVPGNVGAEYASLPKYCGYALYLTNGDPFASATWLEQPQIQDSVEDCAAGAEAAPVGGTPDFSTVYFTYPGTLLSEDAERASHTSAATATPDAGNAWGFYEYSGGVLREAGLLPNGKLSPFGAVPAGSGHGRARFGNQVSEDGERAFFVSPDPASCEPYGENDCTINPPELYVREDGDRTRLVSEDMLLPAEGGQPAAAPDGPSRMPDETLSAFTRHPEDQGAYVFASADGSQAFFQSKDRLTAAAPEGTDSKTYDFDLETGVLTYLPGVEGQVLATDKDGSAFAFVRPEEGSSSAELDIWQSGPVGGTVRPVTQLPGLPRSLGDNKAGVLGSVYISEARMSEDGSVLVFTTATDMSSAFNSGGFEQVYRYDASSNALGCVSCAPAGIVPNGDVSMSSLQPAETYEKPVLSAGGVVESRGISANGDRIFFDTPTPLVPQDTDTSAPEVACNADELCPQGRDVYEWENGVVYLISGGKSPRSSYYLDSSENGDDVFFATAESLVPADTDGGYDVYDARVPQPGDNPPANAVPCEGSVCQGPPREQPPLAPPASATFSGLGNSTPEPAEGTKSVVSANAKPKAKGCPKGKTRKRGSRACAGAKSKKKASGDRRTGR
jgi:hypothetical protein